MTILIKGAFFVTEQKIISVYVLQTDSLLAMSREIMMAWIRAFIRDVPANCLRRITLNQMDSWTYYVANRGKRSMIIYKYPGVVFSPSVYLLWSRRLSSFQQTCYTELEQVILPSDFARSEHIKICVDSASVFSKKDGRWSFSLKVNYCPAVFSFQCFWDVPPRNLLWPPPVRKNAIKKSNSRMGRKWGLTQNPMLDARSFCGPVNATWPQRQSSLRYVLFYRTGIGHILPKISPENAFKFFSIFWRRRPKSKELAYSRAIQRLSCILEQTDLRGWSPKKKSWWISPG